MTTKRQISKRKHRKGFDLKPYLIVIGALLLALTIFVGIRMQSSGRRLIPISVLALIVGVFFESRRLTDKWMTILFAGLGSFILSFVAFLPGKREHIYIFENHIEMWPYAFIIIFILFSIAFHGDKTIPKLTEGITLLQSIAVIYWVVDYGFIYTDNLL